MSDETTKQSEKLVNAIMKGKNLKANKVLEKILQAKCSKKIAETLKQ